MANKKKIGLWVLGIFLVVYLLVEIMIYRQRGLKCIFWHTHLMFYVYLWVAGFVLLKQFFEKKYPGKYRLSIRLLTSVLAAFTIFEALVMLLNTNFSDKKYYWAPYESKGTTYYHTWTPNKDHYLTTSEYSYSRPTNSLGFPDTEWTVKKDSNEIRILCLGDSFTEGDGAHYDSSYVAELKRILKGKYGKITLMNAGVCGSDPFYNYVNLRDKLVQYKPDIIIQVITSNDVEWDYTFRGGLERFIEAGDPGKVRFRQGPWWEPLYAVSYVSRLFFKMAGYDKNLLRPEEHQAAIASANWAYRSLFGQYDSLARLYGARVCLVYLPISQYVEGLAKPFDFSQINDHVSQLSNFVQLDLLPVYKEKMGTTQQEVSAFYWKNDGHHNAKGYQMMAECIGEKIFPLLDSVQSSQK